MAEGIIPDEGLLRGLQWTLDNGDTQTFAWQLLLFVNDLAVDEDSVFVDVVEPSWAGYARVNLPPSGWSVPFLTDHIATATWGTDPVEFVNTTGPTETVYGCAMFDPAFGVLRQIQRFEAGDIRAVAAGESVFLVPRFSRRGTPA